MTLEDVERSALPACKLFDVKRLGAFGSIARGAAVPSSDVRGTSGSGGARLNADATSWLKKAWGGTVNGPPLAVVSILSMPRDRALPARATPSCSFQVLP